MANRPFLCSKCGNWYIAVPTEGECYQCAENLHARHPKTGQIDCHFGHQSATQSEIRMAETLTRCHKLSGEIEASPSRIVQHGTRVAVIDTLAEAEKAFGDMEKAQKGISEILRWAGVFEMPGRKDDSRAGRFKDLETMRQLAEDNRRPKSDLLMLERSVEVCEEMAAEVPALIASARVSIGQARQAATAWKEPGAAEMPIMAPLYVSDKPRLKKTKVAAPA